MNLKHALALSTLCLLTACGLDGSTPWDQNRDGLVTACEGLNPAACDATPGCERGAVFCTMECRDDGHGGCLPCPGGDVCRPVAPNPPLPPAVADCAQVPADLCGFLPMCELVTVEDCGASTPTEPGLLAPCLAQCHTVHQCVNRQPAERCEDLDLDACLSRPGCALEASIGLCDVMCADDSVCPACPDVAPRCVTLPTPGPCDGRDEATCTLDGRCMLEAGPVCDVACTAEGCPPCANPSLRCVPVPPADDCASRDPSVCDVDGRCLVAAGGVCPAVCELDADGGCKPCEAFAVCIPVSQPPPPSRCEGLDRVTCEAVGCEVMELGIACTADCRDDGDGGCLPCPDFVCMEPAVMAVDGGVAPPRP